MIFGYSTAATKDAAFIIEGYADGGGISEFRNNHWGFLDFLTNLRFYHGSITVGQETMIIGGLSAIGQ